MEKFFKSQLYANFWKFSILAPLASGLFTAALMVLTVFFITAAVNQDQDLPYMAATIGGIATCMTFIPALVGFWIVWFLGRKQILSFAAISIITGLLLGLIVFSVFLNPTALFNHSDKTMMVVLDVALFGSVFIFYKLSKKYIEPVLF